MNLTVTTTGPCEEVKNLLHKFFNTTNANEVSETLAELLDAYITKGEAVPEHLAGVVNMVFKLSQLTHALEKIETEGTKKETLQKEVKTQCLHN